MANNSDKINFCVNCGERLTTQSNFCPKCGKPIKQIKSVSNNASGMRLTQRGPALNQKAAEHSSIWQSATTALNHYTGETGPVNINLKNLFSEVFKRHSQNEAEEIFIAGTVTTTPTVSEVSADWGRPWLFSRILMFFGAIFMLLVYIAADMDNSNAIPGVIMIGAFTVPFSALVFFFEMNTYRNISFYEVLKVFFLGVPYLYLSRYFYINLYPFRFKIKFMA